MIKPDLQIIKFDLQMMKKDLQYQHTFPFLIFETDDQWELNVYSHSSSLPPPFPKLNANRSLMRIKLSHYPVWQLKYLMQAYWNFNPLLLLLPPPRYTVFDAWPVRTSYNSILWPLRIKCNPPFHLSTNIAVPGGRSAQIASLSGLGPWCSTKPRPYRVVPPDHRSPAVHPHPSGMPWSGHGHGGSSSSWNRETGKLKQLYRF